MHKVFISYHHKNDQWAKEALLQLNKESNIFIDASVHPDDIDDNLPDDSIRTKIRDEYLKDSTITILLVGTETKNRKHVDWEIYSSMYDGTVNKKSGILVIKLPATGSTACTVAHDNEKNLIYPEVKSWTTYNRQDHEKNNYYLPERIIDNLLKPQAKVSVTYWGKVIKNPQILSALIEMAYKGRSKSEYDLSRPMRRQNS